MIMKKCTWQGILAAIGTILLLLYGISLISGCNETQKIPESDVKLLDQQLAEASPAWKDTYGDTIETQIVYNLAISRANELEIAKMVSRMHPSDANDPNNLKARIEALERRIANLESRFNSIDYIPEFYRGVHDRDDAVDRLMRLITEMNKLSDVDELEKE